MRIRNGCRQSRLARRWNGRLAGMPVSAPFPVSWAACFVGLRGRVLVVSITGEVGFGTRHSSPCVGGPNLPDLSSAYIRHALWLTPLAVLLYANSSLAIPIAVVFAVGAMMIARSTSTDFRPEALTCRQHYRDSDAPRNGSGFRRQFLAVGAAWALKLLFCAASQGNVFAGVVLVAASPPQSGTARCR